MIPQGRKGPNAVPKVGLKPTTSSMASTPVPSVALLILSCISAFFVLEIQWFRSEYSGEVKSTVNLIHCKEMFGLEICCSNYSTRTHRFTPYNKHGGQADLFRCEQLYRARSTEKPVGRVSAISIRVWPFMTIPSTKGTRI